MESKVDYRACAFCNARIEKGSICDDCSKKYDIRAYNSLDDGCGCDTK